jgi:hypothetical protein
MARDDKVLTERDLTLGGVAGREIVVERLAGKVPALLTMRVHLVGNTLHTLTVVVPTRQPLKEDTTRFLDSFSLLQ